MVNKHEKIWKVISRKLLSRKQTWPKCQISRNQSDFLKALLILIRMYLRMWLRLFFKVFFTRKYIKIIYFFIFLKLFLTSAYQNDLKIPKKY
jgi:hypothetical protein